MKTTTSGLGQAPGRLGPFWDPPKRRPRDDRSGGPGSESRETRPESESQRRGERQRARHEDDDDKDAANSFMLGVGQRFAWKTFCCSVACSVSVKIWFRRLFCCREHSGELDFKHSGELQFKPERNANGLRVKRRAEGKWASRETKSGRQMGLV